MVWIGLVRPIAGYLLFAPCGPVWSKLSASEITLPFLTNRVAAMMSSCDVKLSVPISSFGPHLPQFLYFSAASRMSWRVIFLAAIGFPLMKRNGWWQEYSPCRLAIASPYGAGEPRCYDVLLYPGCCSVAPLLAKTCQEHGRSASDSRRAITRSARQRWAKLRHRRCEARHKERATRRRLSIQTR